MSYHMHPLFRLVAVTSRLYRVEEFTEFLAFDLNFFYGRLAAYWHGILFLNTTVLWSMRVDVSRPRKIINSLSR